MVLQDRLQNYLQLKNGTDVRGVASADGGREITLSPFVAERVAEAFCAWLICRTKRNKLRIAVGYDSRGTGPALCEAVVKGINETGNDAVRTDLSSTPSMFMLLKDETYACDGSIMITASHLPADRNGLKFFTPEGGLSGGDVEEILTLAYEGSFRRPKEEGGVEDKPYLDTYAAALVKKVRDATGEKTPLAGKRIVVDAGNGAGGFYAEKVLKPLGADTDGSQFLDPDGTFPNHIPNPENEEAMRSVCAAVKAAGADFGIIFDTDVDRAGAVDSAGEEINRNRLIALVSAILLAERAGTIVTDSVTSDGLTEFIAARGGRHRRFRRGYKNVIDEAVRLNAEGEYAPLAIETSGHAAFKENYFLDDGAYLVTRLLIFLAKEAKAGRNVTDVLAGLKEPVEALELRPAFIPGCDFKAEGAKILADLDGYARALPYAEVAPENFEGVRINFDKENGDGWALVRMSLHEPIMPINAESNSIGGTEKIVGALSAFFKNYPCLAFTGKTVGKTADAPELIDMGGTSMENTEDKISVGIADGHGDEATESAVTTETTDFTPAAEETTDAAETTEIAEADNAPAEATEEIAEKSEEAFYAYPTEAAEEAENAECETDGETEEESASAAETLETADEETVASEESAPIEETTEEVAIAEENAPVEDTEVGGTAEEKNETIENGTESVSEETTEASTVKEGDKNMDVQQTTINAIRILSAEAIEKAKSGHPGLPLGSAPIGYTLFQYFLKFNPKDAKWENRDRFVLSAGHGSMLDYSLLYLYGYDLTKEDLMNFRQLDSRTPGHPEYGHTIGIETTTGPLGQGIANAVGMAVAEAHLAATYNKPGFPVVDHYTYALCGDGCLEEGISYEACSFAGTHALGKLILFYDDNDITIEGDTDVTFKENIGARFAAMNWQVLHVDLITSPDDVEAISKAVEKAKARTDKPSVIICHTRIGYGSPLEGSEKCHGAPLGADNLQKTKEKLGWSCAEAFDCPDAVFEHCAIAADAGAEKEMQWKKMFAEYEYAYPDAAAAYKAAMNNEKPDLAAMEELFEFNKPMATRQTSSVVLNKLAAVMPQLMGGSADLAPSNLTQLKDANGIEYGVFKPDSYEGRNMHFGIREHAMAAIANGMQLHGGIQAYCATFFVFSDYCKPAMRLSALMNIPVTYVMTHDSIGVGEDGPTHEPVEQLIALRSIPNMKVYRPADGKETAAAWISALTGTSPTTLVLTRQALPQYETSGLAALKGGYTLQDCEGTPDVLLIGSGSEVELCVKAKAALEEEGIKARVVSMPCIEEFEKQSVEYKDSVLPAAVTARVCVEAGSPYSWYRYAGTNGEIVAMNTFGASAPAARLFEKFGFTTENVVEKAKASIAGANK